MTAAAVALPPTVQVIERGWLSSNSILCVDGERATLVDSGYGGHAAQTVALVKSALAERHLHGLQRLINTHSHSDHIGGNAALKAAFDCEIVIPAGIAKMVGDWDEEALLLTTAGQRAERFIHDELIAANSEFEMGGLVWQALPAPGHDMHALIFYCAEERLLISGDALWQDGFGVVFSELMTMEPDAAAGIAISGFAATRQTLDTIAALDIAVVVPGHGPAFVDVDAALARAYSRLDLYASDKLRLARNALKACFTFNLLDLGRLAVDDLPEYLNSVPLFARTNRSFLGMSDELLAQWLLDSLLRVRAVEVKDGWLLPLKAA